ncbi:MAG: porin [Planctomycetota bacterium]|nr:MAG: porin [Planctomycetota bacterium]
MRLTGDSVELFKPWLALAIGLLLGRMALLRADAWPNLSSDDAPLPAEAAPVAALLWQGPALDAGPGGTDEAVEYGQARLLPTVDSSKKFPKVTLGGLLQVDAGWFNQSTSSQKSVGDVQDAAGMRRARILAFGSLAENIDFRLGLDFAAPARPSFVDAFLDFTKIPTLGVIRVGQFRQPEGLELLTAQRFGIFMERAPNILLMPTRRIGIGTFNRSEDGRATWFFSAYRSGTDQYANDSNDNGAFAGMSRLTWVVWDGDRDRYLHIGGSFGFSGATNGRIQYGKLGGNSPEWGLFVGTQGTPEFTQSTPSFVNTGQFTALNAVLSNFEAVWNYGPVAVQGEFTTSQVNRPDMPYAFFSACYGQVSYLITGEYHPYNRNLAVIDRVIPNTEAGPGRPFGGAWEIAARLSTIDLTSGTVHGGQLTDGTAGLSWYANPYTRVYFNFIHSFLQKGPVGPSNANVFAMRAQVDF